MNTAGHDYDVFISYKSEDHGYAKLVYDFLQSHGLAVFFSKESLPKLGSDEYRQQIDQAIDRARNMIVVATSKEHINARWVSYEWGLFLGEKISGRKEGNLLTVLADGLNVSDLPISLRNREAIPLVEGEIERLIEYCKKDRQIQKQEIFRIDIRRRKIFWGERPKKHAELADLGRDHRIDGDKKGNIVTIWESAQSDEGLRLCKIALPVILKSKVYAHSVGIDMSKVIIKDNNGKGAKGRTVVLSGLFYLSAKAFFFGE